jgi:hypothetical protein
MILLLGLLDGTFSLDMVTILMVISGPFIGGVTLAFLERDGSDSGWFLILEVAMVISMALMSLVAIALLVAIVAPIAVVYFLGLLGYNLTNRALSSIKW